MGAGDITRHTAVEVLTGQLREASRAGDHATVHRVGALLTATLEGGRTRALLAGDVEVVNEIDRLMHQLEAVLGQAGRRAPDGP